MLCIGSLLSVTALINAAVSLVQVSAISGKEIDIVNVKNIVNLYPRAVDRPDYSLFSVIFTCDVVVDYSASGVPITNGISAFVDSLSSSRTAKNYTTQHHLGSQYVNVTSTSTASATSYIIATFFGHGDLEGQA
ncbi:hypothetical protein PT974_02953 [Cladobotryum mycophilum]|uniref:SnoaL-like domain-containing protein n=1 Tax=Cladobotryum mycophilum TaxID=491253 RepID=A0ABR0T0Q9_9HYPO